MELKQPLKSCRLSAYCLDIFNEFLLCDDDDDQTTEYFRVMPVVTRTVVVLTCII